MPNVKISDLPSASTPLAGTELVPVVQSGVTEKVTVDDLTAGRAVSALDVTVSNLTASQAVLTDANKKLVSVATTGSGSVVRTTSPTLVTPVLGTPTSVTLTNATGLPLTTGVTGVLPVANGGTGVNSLTASRIPYGNGTSAFASSANLTFANDTLSVHGILVGRGAGGNVTNTALGANALEDNTTGDSATAVGYAALKNNTTGINNTAVGHEAMQAITTGSTNTAIGRRALYATQTGQLNTALGKDALTNLTTGSQVVAVGNGAGLASTTGDDNTFVGASAGDLTTTGSRNVILGAFSDPSANNGNDQIVIGYLLTGKGDDTAFIGGTNGAYNEKNVTTWETTSDRRIKRNINDNHQGLEVIERIRVRNFEYRLPDEIDPALPRSTAVNKAGVQIGVIAQELQEVLPGCVTANSTGVLSVNTDPLLWYLINAVQQLAAEVKALKETKQ